MLVNNESQCVLTSRIGCKASCKANTVAEKWNSLNGKSNVNQWFPLVMTIQPSPLPVVVMNVWLPFNSYLCNCNYGARLYATKEMP
jgi:hypothetical protein